VGVMPYPIEKGLFPILIESWFNDEMDYAACDESPADILGARNGPRRRLRAIWRYAGIVQKLKAAKQNENSIADVTDQNSLVLSSFFSQNKPGLSTFQRIMAEKWFGMVQKKNGTGWTRRPASAWTPGATLGHWTGYYGNVELIMVEAIQRMLEVSLGLEHMTEAPKTKKAQDKAEASMRDAATRVWPLYLFLTCPQPWYGAWVTWQCHDRGCAVRGQVTGLLQTPGHGWPIAPSPIDREGDKKMLPLPGGGQVQNPYYLHGREPSTPSEPNSGYAGVYLDRTGVRRGADPRTASGDQGMWVVTHENHDSTIVWSSFREPTPGNWPGPGGIPDEAWELPPIATYRCATLDQRRDHAGFTPPKPNRLDGYYDIVVVSPASLDGGVP